MSRHFDLDRLIEEKRTVSFGGVVHVVHEMTLKESILVQEWAKELDMLEFTKRAVSLYLPTANIDDLPAIVLNSLFEFLSGQSEKNEE